MRRLLGALLAAVPLFLACRPDVTAPREAPPPSLEIRDGANLGNVHFFFLPPMQAMPAYSGSSNPNANPAVSICEWNPVTGKCGAVIAEFAMSETAETISYDVMGEKYQVNWHTDQCLEGACALDPAKTYRIRVLVGAAELGHADVDVVSAGNQLKNAETNEYIGLVDGRTLPIKFRVEQGAVAVVASGGSVPVGIGGGAVTTADGSVSLDFPAGALGGTTNISVTPVTDPAEGTGPWAPVVDLGPDGSSFAQPVTLSIEYKPENLPEGIPPSALHLVTFDGAGWAPVPGSTIDSIDNRISASISHFSYYGIGIRPNNATGTYHDSVRVGSTRTASGSVWYYQVVPSTYCYSVRVSFFSRRTICQTTTRTYQYPVSGAPVYWSILNPVLASVSAAPTYTNSSGHTLSPPILGRYPGATGVRATSYNNITATYPLTVLGVLGLLPKTATNVAGWAVGERITTNVALAADQPVQLTNQNAFLTVAEAGTSNYTYGGQTGTYVIPAGALFKQLAIHGLSGVGTDTLIAAAPGFVPDTAIIRLTRGKFLVTGWPANLTAGDSAALTITVADSSGALGNLSQLINVSLAGTGAISFSNGTAAITTVPIQQRTSGTFYLKATGGGAGSVTISHPDYGPYTNTVALTGVPVIVTDPATREANTITLAAGGLARKSIPITNGGTLPLTGLDVGGGTICGTSQSVPWVKATLAGTSAPTSLDILATPPGFQAVGTYEICFTITATAPGTQPKPYGVTITLNPALVGPQSVCGHTIAGIAFDGVVYWVGEAHDGLLQCLSSWVPNTGRLNATTQHFLDFRGLHWVPALGRLTSRTWGGPISAVTLGGSPVQLASNPTQSRPGDEQSQPAVDPDGVSYWIRNGAVAERRQLSDHALLKSFPVASTGAINTIAVSNEWVFVLDGAGVNGYSKATGSLAGRQPLPFAHPCNNFGFGASLNADRFMYVRADCRTVEVVMRTVTFAEPGPAFGMADLGTLGGAGNSEALTLNDAGRTVGVSNNAGFYMDANASSPTAVTNPFGDISWAYGVTSSGLIAATNPYSGYLWHSGTGAITGPPPGPFTQNNRRMVMGVNASGTKVLACADNGSFFQNYVWDVATGALRLIPGAYNFCLGRITGNAVVVNADPGAGGRAFLWNDDLEQALPLPVSSIGWDVNESYVVVGSIEMQTGHRNAFRFTAANNQTVSLGALGGTTSEAKGINNAGFIVGWSLNAAGQRRGFVWDPGQERMYELAPLPGHTESQANDINSNGVIVGYSSVGGVKRAVRWTPQ